MPRLLLTTAAAATLAGGGLLTGVGAHATVAPCDTGAAERVVAASTVPLPDGWTVEVGCGGPDGVAGQADPGSRTITIWADRHRRDTDIAWTWLHEVGHAWDVAGGVDRGAWVWLRGLDSDVWWGAGAEDLAEGIAYCLMPDGDPRGGSGWQPPTAVQCQVATAPIGGVR